VSWFYRIAGQFPSLVIARRNISRAKTRSALAALTILIGVVAIGVIGAGGSAFKQSQLQTIRDQGANNVFVSPGFDSDQPFFDREDVKAIEETVGEAGVVATNGDTMEYVKRGSNEVVSVTYMEDPRALYSVARGEIPANWRGSVVVSHDFAAENGIEPGDRIRLTTFGDPPCEPFSEAGTYRVAAVLEETQAFGVDDVFFSIEDVPSRTYSQIRITTQSVDRAEVVADALRDRFNERKDRLLVLELTSIVRLFKAVVNGINVFLTGLGAISLLVAGVSIANTMLMATIKRREEIGVLRAVGYQKRDIVRILLVEAAVLGGIGAVVGFVLSLLVTMVANAVFLGSPTAFTGEAFLFLGGSIAFGILTSLLAGVYPAWRAANEKPVDALRG
jgi:putative ABC transport system permease protein